MTRVLIFLLMFLDPLSYLGKSWVGKNLVTTFVPIKLLVLVELFARLDVQAARVLRDDSELLLLFVAPPPTVLVNASAHDHNGGRN